MSYFYSLLNVLLKQACTFLWREEEETLLGCARAKVCDSSSRMDMRRMVVLILGGTL